VSTPTDRVTDIPAEVGPGKANTRKPLFAFTFLAACCGMLVSMSNFLSVDIISENQLRFEQKQMREILGNHQAEVSRIAPDVFQIGTIDEPQGFIFKQLTNDGYNGQINLWIGVDTKNNIIGVRVIDHKETPGLGDKIEAGVSGWIHTFEGRSLLSEPDAAWTVKKDGGVFDQFSGATITPRAVVIAVKAGLERSEREQETWLNRSQQENQRLNSPTMTQENR